MTATMPAPTRAQTTTLDRLAREIQTAHEAALCDHLENARRAGVLLGKVKGMLPHGQFLPWVQQHCRIVPRTAQLYMQIAREWPKIANAQRVAHLSLRQAVRLLAGDDESAPGESDPPRIGADCLREIDRFLTALRRVQEMPDRLRAIARLIEPRLDEVDAEVQRVRQLLAGRAAP